MRPGVALTKAEPVPTGEVTQVDLALSLGIAVRTISMAQKVLASGSYPLIRGVESGRITVSKAYAIAELTPLEHSIEIERLGKKPVSQMIEKIQRLAIDKHLRDFHAGSTGKFAG